jgi:hypothetical protein
MSEFIVDSKTVEHAIANPFDGNKNPVNAAYGRAAEPFLKKFSSQELGIPFSTPTLALIRKMCPGANAGFMWQGKIVIYCDGIYVQDPAILEVKLDCGNDVTLSKNEYAFMKYCLEKNIPYYLGFGKLLDKKTYKCQYLGVVQFTEALSKRGPRYQVSELM